MKTAQSLDAAIGAAAADSTERAKPKLPLVQRRQVELLLEKVIEFLIRLSGISAVVFVFAIFFFVFREGAPILSKLDLWKFLFTQTWYPTSQGNPRFGVGALIIGTLSVTALSM